MLFWRLCGSIASGLISSPMHHRGPPCPVRPGVRAVPVPPCMPRATMQARPAGRRHGRRCGTSDPPPLGGPACRRGCPGGAWDGPRGGPCGDGPSARSSQWIVCRAEARLRLRPGRRMSPGCPQRRLPPGWAAAPRRRRCPRTGPWPSPG